MVKQNVRYEKGSYFLRCARNEGCNLDVLGAVVDGNDRPALSTGRCGKRSGQAGSNAIKRLLRGLRRKKGASIRG